MTNAQWLTASRNFPLDEFDKFSACCVGSAKMNKLCPPRLAPSLPLDSFEMGLFQTRLERIKTRLERIKRQTWSKSICSPCSAALGSVNIRHVGNVKVDELPNYS